ncbi:SIS domain-containing protein [Vagococcus fluvialis]|uniref:sugar isomerase domain-containing protein n=1 Tax=Vagococcus fluvialis TaxID=2738 RepID=UPI001432B266|nr:SIS domain-containing protein [Vagococcus fluvialis]NKC59079.1 SIS domain-containing protein [Vagococcus fluvialis]NKD49835.1 SIS domain-containing protein [Vagococcus fluvialis]
MFQYMDKVTEILKVVKENESGVIQEAIDLMTEANLNKQSVFIFGASHAGILMEEMYYRAGGMMTINPIFGREVMLDRSPITFTSQMERLEGYGTSLASTVDFKENDVLILHSVSGRNPIIIDIAIAAREKGVKLIGLTNVSYSKSVTSRHSSGKRLFEVVDIVIDNHGDIGDACCDIKGIEQKVGASSTVVGASILNTIIVETCQKLVDSGVKYPPIFYSANLDGGDQLNQNLYEQYKDSIHYQF